MKTASSYREAHSHPSDEHQDPEMPLARLIQAPLFSADHNFDELGNLGNADLPANPPANPTSRSLLVASPLWGPLNAGEGGFTNKSEKNQFARVHRAAVLLPAETALSCWRSKLFTASPTRLICGRPPRCSWTVCNFVYGREYEWKLNRNTHGMLLNKHILCSPEPFHASRNLMP